jgi:uncharacterized membrane protein (DUF4010 family)
MKSSDRPPVDRAQRFAQACAPWQDAATAVMSPPGDEGLPDLAQFEALLIALGCGLLIGAERERRNAARATRSAAGLRTFAIAGLGGGIAMIGGGAMLLGVLVLAAAALATASYVRARDLTDPGVTTELALVATVLLGGLAVPEPLLAGGAAVMVAVVLAARAPLHRFVGEVLSERELADVLVLGGAALVLLPLLPDRAMGPFAAINPYAMGLVVIMILAITAAGEVAMRALGARLGVPVLGLVSGFASSSATIGAMGGWVRAAPQCLNAGVAAALLSAVATFVQLMAVIGATNAAMLSVALVPCAAAALTALGLGGLFAARGYREPPGEAPRFGQGLRIVMALGFAAMLAAMLVVVAALRAEFGATGLIAGALLGGVIDVHAASIAIATQVADGALTPNRAVLPLLLAWSTSTLAKLVLTLAAGSRKFALRVAPGLLLILGAAWLAAWLRGFG